MVEPIVSGSLPPGKRFKQNLTSVKTRLQTGMRFDAGQCAAHAVDHPDVTLIISRYSANY